MRLFKQILKDRFSLGGNEDPVKIATEAVKEWLGEKRDMITQPYAYEKRLYVNSLLDELNERTPAPPTPTGLCPKCGGRPIRWIPEYQRWYCETEKKYL